MESLQPPPCPNTTINMCRLWSAEVDEAPAGLVVLGSEGSATEPYSPLRDSFRIESLLSSLRLEVIFVCNIG